MTLFARFVLPGAWHHVAQRGSRRQPTFFNDGDCAAFRNLLAEHCLANDVSMWSWVLMLNRVHPILVPACEGGLRATLDEAHRRFL